MKIGVFHATGAPPPDGPYVVREDIFDGLVASVGGSGHELVVFTPDESAKARAQARGVSWVHVPGLRWRAAVSSLKQRVNRVFAHGLLVPAPFARESWLDTLALAEGLDLFVHMGADAISLSVPYVCIVFDELQYRTHPFMPESSAPGQWERLDERYRQTLGRATFVVTGTRAGQHQIARYYHVSRKRLIRLPHPTPGFALAASREPRRPRPEYLRPGPFIVYPAAFWPHKNHVTLLEALAQLRTTHGFDVQLVLAGSDEGNRSFVVERIAALGLSDAVHVRGVVERPELIALYQHALALTYVSICGPENLPPLEAFALGCPVINTNLPGAREQLGAAALIVPMLDPAPLAEAVLTVHRDVCRREALVAAGRAIAAERTGEQFARQLFEAIAPFAEKRKSWSTRTAYVRPHRIGRLYGQ